AYIENHQCVQKWMYALTRARRVPFEARPSDRADQRRVLETSGRQATLLEDSINLQSALKKDG
ncbi:unnamed protein product, partial [Citrullus colocynthis]